jgi:6-pyruvoyltetrahydropterin/6-carboxytetrahydropterin synthase
LNFACLNDIRGLENPTSELISNWIWQRLKRQLPELSWVTVYETANCSAHFDGTHYRLWRETTLDSAMRLMRAPESDPRRRVHGHTYTLRLHLHAPLDDVMGWIIDFGDVKQLFGPVFEQLDHHPLHEVSDWKTTTLQPPFAGFGDRPQGFFCSLIGSTSMRLEAVGRF